MKVEEYGKARKLRLFIINISLHYSFKEDMFNIINFKVKSI